MEGGGTKRGRGSEGQMIRRAKTVDLAGTATIYSGGQLAQDSIRLVQETIFENVTVSLGRDQMSLIHNTNYKNPLHNDTLTRAIPGFVSTVDATGRIIPAGSVKLLHPGPNGHVFSGSFNLGSRELFKFILKLEKIKVDKWASAKETARVCAAMNECGLVRYRAWMKSNERVHIKATLMEKMERDMYTLLYEERFTPDYLFVQSLAVFLLKVNECLETHSASFADLKLENIGVNTTGGVVFRLLDLDSINVFTYTPGYFLIPSKKGVDKIHGELDGDSDRMQRFLRAASTFCVLTIAATVCALGNRNAAITMEGAVADIYNALDHFNPERTEHISVRQKVEYLEAYIRACVSFSGGKLSGLNEMTKLVNQCSTDLKAYFSAEPDLYEWDTSVGADSTVLSGAGNSMDS